MDDNFENKMDELRLKAESFLNEQSKIEMNFSNQDLSTIIHDLRVYQIELELQNEELRNTQKKLEETRNNYIDLYNKAPNGYLTLSSNGQIIQANQTFINMIGVESSTIILKSFADLITEDDRAEFLGRFNAFFKNPIDKSFESKLIRKNSSAIFVSITGRSVFITNENVHDNHPQLLLSIIDISKMKEDESKLLEAKEKAEESDRLKTAFLQNMSHEIRTPLNGIIGFSGLLQIDDVDKEDIKEFSNIIKQSGTRLLEIINNVLDISKIETGQMNVNKDTFSINTMLIDLFKFFSPFSSTKNIKLSYTSSLDDSKCQIISDATKLNQILTNLINNAIKFSQSGSIDFGYELVNNVLKFWVKDTGLGVSLENQDKIFDRFVQVDTKHNRGFDGTGLGLAICKGLVELLGGKIWMESELGVGTTFFFTIPYLESTNIINHFDNSNNSIVNQKKIKILVVDDDFTSYRYLKIILKDDNIVVLYAENGQKAVDYVKTENYIDIILMDIKMPIMDGIESSIKIKQINPKITIIAQTAYAFNTEKELFLSIGCDDYIAKPIEKEALLRLIQKYSRAT